MSSSYYTEFGFEIYNRKFAVKIPKLKIRTPRMLLRRKNRNPQAAAKSPEPCIRLEELNSRYNDFLTVTREKTRLASESETSQSTSSSQDVKMNESNESQPAFVDIESDDIEISKEFTSPCRPEYEDYQRSSTPVSFSLLTFNEDRKVIVLKDVSGVKIYEDIFSEDSEELISFLEESGATVYEEFDHSSPIYENLDNLSSIVL
eukprot:GFUD01138042.1.p1 GENE.GFUD01138042.1~~GFUD01138042.1.p1  ORF type:complete len:236 (+),score=51.06 GFUD01138042.1:97-708(+)